ncbi:MAG: hypothetical protein QW514_03570 [Thermoprotei archaeon]
MIKRPKIRKSRTNTVISLVREEVELDQYIQDALSRGYANLSALARQIKPRIETKTGQKITNSSVVTALKRIRTQRSNTERAVETLIANSVITVRTNVAKLSLERTKHTLKIVAQIISAHHEEFIQLSETYSSITLVFDQKILEKIKQEIPSHSVLEEGSDYAAIIIHSPQEFIYTPGALLPFYAQLSRRGINIDNTVSCYTDTVIVVNMKDAGRAFEALTELITHTKNKLTVGQT